MIKELPKANIHQDSRTQGDPLRKFVTTCNERSRTLLPIQCARTRPSGADASACPEHLPQSNAEREYIQWNGLKTLSDEQLHLSLGANLNNMRENEKRSEAIASEASERCQQLNRELVKVEREAIRAMQRKEEERKLALLELESRLNSHKAECAELKAAFTKEKMKPTVREEGDDERRAAVVEGQTFFLEKLQQLHHELAASQRKWGEEKRSIVSSHAAAQQELAARYSLELSQLRSSLVASEDETSSQKDKCREVEKQKISLLKKIEESTQKQSQLKSEIAQLRGEVQLTRQSLQAVQGANLYFTGDDRDGRDQANSKAANEPLVRALNNKVEYLKAQLASEAALKDEYVATIDSLRSE